MARPPAQPARRCGGDGGAVLVEAAIVFPLIVVFVSGLAEFGIAFRNRNIINSAMRAAVRVEAQMGKNAYADRSALSTLNAQLSKYKNTTINKVVVFNANSTSSLPASCNLTPLPGGTGYSTSPVFCNVYGPTQIAQIVAGTSPASAWSTVTPCTGAWDKFWCPLTRETSLNAANGPDYVGLYISTNYTMITKILPGTSNLTINDTVVARLEPAVS